MRKTTHPPCSRYSREAVCLLGKLIRRCRIERGITVQALADRAGISRGLVQRIERGDMGCAIGSVFEVAAIVWSVIVEHKAACGRGGCHAAFAATFRASIFCGCAR